MYLLCVNDFVVQDEDFYDALSNFKSLRVLDLNLMRIKELPASICKLKHLRFLDVSETKIEELPKSITRLYNLRTLRLKNCKNLKVLPQDIGKLVNLRHLEIDTSGKWTVIPKDIGKLTCLRTLPFFRVGNSDVACTLSKLEHLNLLQDELRIYYLDHVKDVPSVEKAKLSAKKDLDILKLEWNWDEEDDINYDNIKDDYVLESMEFHSNLEVLQIIGFCGTKFPRWITSSSTLNSLVKIYFSKRNICQFLPSFGGLPALKYLSIDDMAGQIIPMPTSLKK